MYSFKGKQSQEGCQEGQCLPGLWLKAKYRSGGQEKSARREWGESTAPNLQLSETEADPGAKIIPFSGCNAWCLTPACTDVQMTKAAERRE